MLHEQHWQATKSSLWAHNENLIVDSKSVGEITPALGWYGLVESICMIHRRLVCEIHVNLLLGLANVFLNYFQPLKKVKHP